MKEAQKFQVIESNIESTVDFNYKIPEGDYKFKYDGNNLTMDILLGKMTYNNANGATEVYEAYKIELHYPSEHYLTLSTMLTPRCDLELQIHHRFVSTSEAEITNAKIRVKFAIFSIFFTETSNVGANDNFFEGLGIHSIYY